MKLNARDVKLCDLIIFIIDQYKEVTSVTVQRFSSEWSGCEIRIRNAENGILYCSMFYNFDEMETFSILFPRTGGGSYESQKKVISTNIQTIKDLIISVRKSESKLDPKQTNVL